MSGLSHTPGKRAWVNPHRGFESRLLRQQLRKPAPIVALFYFLLSQYKRRKQSTLNKPRLARYIWQMELLLNSISANRARASLEHLIERAAESHKPITIIGKRSNAVLVSEEDWSVIQETLYLMANSEVRDSLFR